MADTRISIILDAKDNASRKLQGVADTIENSLDRVGIAAGIAAAAIAAFSAKSIGAFLDAENAAARLRKITQNSVGATEDQVQALLDQASALEKVGVVSADVIVGAQGTLATFDLQTESIKRLIPSFLDMVVAEKGVNATTEDMTGYANALGGALMGNFAALTQRGFKLDEDTKAIIANGTETERITALVGVLNSTYEGMNETFRATTAGGLKGAQIAMDNLQQTIGGALVPALNGMVAPITNVIQKVDEWVKKNPELTAKIIMASLAITGFVAALAAAGPVIGVVAQAVALLGTPIGYVLAAVVLITAAFVFMRGKVAELYQTLQDWGVVQAVQDALTRLWDVVQNQLLPAWQQLWTALQPFMPMLKALAGLIGTLLVGALILMLNALTLLISIYSKIIEVVAKFVTQLTKDLKPAIDFVTGVFTSFRTVVSGTIDIINKATSAITSFIAKAKEAASAGIGGAVSSVASKIGGLFGAKAGGGPVMSGLPYLVGEQGAEVFVPSSNGRIVPNGGLAMAGAGAGGITVNVSNNSFGANMDPRDVALSIGDELMRALKLNSRV